MNNNTEGERRFKDAKVALEDAENDFARKAFVACSRNSQICIEL